MGLRGSNNRRIVIAAVQERIERLLKQITLDIVANLRRAASEGGSPVDTGWLRANWIANIGEAPSGTVGTREQAQAGAVNNAAGEQAIAEVASSYKLERGPIFVSNNVPYVIYVNERGGKVAPKFFIQRAIKEAVDRARRGKL